MSCCFYEHSPALVSVDWEGKFYAFLFCCEIPQSRRLAGVWDSFEKVSSAPPVFKPPEIWHKYLIWTHKVWHRLSFISVLRSSLVRWFLLIWQKSILSSRCKPLNIVRQSLSRLNNPETFLIISFSYQAWQPFVFVPCPSSQTFYRKLPNVATRSRLSAVSHRAAAVKQLKHLVEDDDIFFHPITWQPQSPWSIPLLLG